MSLESKEVIGLDDATETIETVNLLSTVTDLDSGIDDSISISVPKKVAMMSELIKTMIDGGKLVLQLFFSFLFFIIIVFTYSLVDLMLNRQRRKKHSITKCKTKNFTKSS